jgi:hypothetical protein
MGHWSYLIGCPSEDDIQRSALTLPHDQGDGADRFGPELRVKYRVSLFWLAAFDEACVRRVTRRDEPEHEDEEAFAHDFIVLWSPTHEAVQRLRRRRDGVLAMVKDLDGPLYDAWIAFIEQNYPTSILLQPEDVMDMDGIDTSGPRMVSALRSLAAIDSGMPVTEIGDLRYFGALSLGAYGEMQSAEDFALDRRAALAGLCDDLAAWPGLPRPDEIAAAKFDFAPELRAMAQAHYAMKPKSWWRFWS